MATELAQSMQGEQAQEVRRAVEDLSGLSVLMKVSNTPLTNPLKVAATLQANLEVLKFSESFYFLDCGPQDPFC